VIDAVYINRPHTPSGRVLQPIGSGELAILQASPRLH
jgi:hypothetical protein